MIGRRLHVPALPCQLALALALALAVAGCTTTSTPPADDTGASDETGDTGDDSGFSFDNGSPEPGTGDEVDATSGDLTDATGGDGTPDATGDETGDETGDDPPDATGGGGDEPGDPDDAGNGGNGGDEELPPPPDAFEGPDDCLPDCSGKVCGSNGCGGICGYCTYPLVCNSEGSCVDVCQVECENKACGPDGCGGICGECQEPLLCGEDGQCYEPDCVANCVGKVCGSNGCGGDCGVCPSPKICVNGGCALGPCGTVTDTGECQGNVAVWCIDLVTLVEDDCDANYADDHECVYDGFANQYVCSPKAECEPTCEGKKCGSDGCGGTCPPGCNEGWACVLGECEKEAGAACGPVTAIGQCEDNVLWFCSNDKLYSVDCTLTGETCNWDQTIASYECL